MPAGGYRIRAAGSRCEITGGDGAGVLYGVFALLRALQMAGKRWDEFALEEQNAPSNALRMLDHWDNLPGDIERGYSGRSFFFKDDDVLVNQRTVDYARLAASVGINGMVLNNVNVKGAAAWLISERYYVPLRQIQEILSGYGIKMYLCVNFAASIVLGGLDTAAPCEERVQDWWKAKVDEVWANLPGLGGFVVKADSEGQPGPYTYGRDQSDGGNLLADAVAPHGGHIIWRCFVYNCQQDWRDTKTDRAKAGYDNFMPLDGKTIAREWLRQTFGKQEQVEGLKDLLKPDVYERMAQFELTLLDWAENHKGSRKYVAFADKCWPAFPSQFGFEPCYVNSRLAARGIPVACEVDIYGALSEYIGACVSGDAVTLLDINNSVPAQMWAEQIKGKYDYTLTDTFMGFHCGNTPACKLCADRAVKYQLIQRRLLDPKDPKKDDRDRFVLSKGHTAPGLYSALANRGFFPVDDLPTLRHTDSYLQGHPNMNTVPGVDMSTGSLGQGISCACGMALGLKKQGSSARVYTLLGDGEMQEGQVGWHGKAPNDEEHAKGMEELNAALAGLEAK